MEIVNLYMYATLFTGVIIRDDQHGKTKMNGHAG